MFAFACNTASETPPTSGEIDAGTTIIDTGVIADTGVMITDAGPPADAGSPADAAEPPPEPAPAVYTLSNEETGNAVLAYARDEDGALQMIDRFGTGGLGSGGGLGSQGALVLDDTNARMYAVNNGDHSIAMLDRLEDGSLQLTSTVASGGVGPVSITARDDVAYVVNAGDEETPANIAGFRIVGGTLTPIPGSVQALSVDAPGPAQIEFTPDGRQLIVTEKGTSSIDVFNLEGGVAAPAIIHRSAGMTPFGFDFTAAGHLVVSEAFGGEEGAGASSTYALDALGGTLRAVSSAVRTEQSAPCWVALAGDHYAYVTNTRSNTISGYDIGDDGNLTYTWSAPTGDGPIDAIVADDFLYVLNARDDTFSVYAVNTANGTLMARPALTGLPEGAVGVAAGPRAVYTMSNASDSNEILAYVRAIDGGLAYLGATATGGAGRGGGLGSQNALVFADGRVFAVNAGDDTVSMLRVESDGTTTLMSTVNAGGISPRSLTVHGDLLYVANAGDDMHAANISGFRIAGGELVPISDSSRAMSAANPGPGQLSFADAGRLLVLTEKGTDHITTYRVADGLAGPPVVHTSRGRTPFGFAINAQGTIVVSEAAGGDDGEGTASSYRTSTLGSLETLSASVQSGQSAPCWVVVHGDFAYVTNTRTDNVSAYRIGADGALTLLWSAQAGDAPIDASVSADGFLYVLNARDDSLSIYEISEADGVLLQKPSFTGLPESAVGLVAR